MSAELSEFEKACLYRGLVKRACTDPQFRNLLRRDPRAAAVRVLGRPLPEGFVLKVAFEGAGERIVPLDGVAGPPP